MICPRGEFSLWLGPLEQSSTVYVERKDISQHCTPQTITILRKDVLMIIQLRMSQAAFGLTLEWVQGPKEVREAMNF